MSSEQKSGIGQNVISLPKGGGAIAGMGETFAPDLFTGTGNFSVPIAVPPGRNGLQPSLTLGYSTGSGNGPFGLGWNLSLPGVSRKTNLGIPRYEDDKDVFVLSGAEDLIPVDRGQETTSNVVHRWIRYRPRTEGLFARIIHHTFSDGQDYWEVRTKDGMVTWYGKPGAQAADNTVVHDPENAQHIASWMIHRTADPFGNEVVYEYERELQLTPYPFTQLHLKRIKYVDHMHAGVRRHLCSVELEYTGREDAHSEFRQGFEIRTTRRCKAIHTRTHPLDADMPAGHAPSGTNDNTVPVKTYHLTYRDELGRQALNKVSMLAHVRAEGHDGPLTESLPPVEFEYTDFDVEQRDLTVLDGDHLPALGLAHPEMDLVDLDGNGLPDLVQMSAGQPIRYWKNRGKGEFDRVRTMQYSPLGLSLQDPGVNLMDADGDGRLDLVLNRSDFAGYYSLDHNGEWDKDSFRSYPARPPVNLKSAQAQFIDLSGDGRTDVLINTDRFICYFQNSPLLDVNRNFDGLQSESRAIGWSEGRFVNKAGLDDFPNVDFGDPRIRTADLSGDGLQDIVQIQNGSICYWPNLGYGRFGKKRTMRNSPRLGYDFNPAQLVLGDADGDGLTDVILIERNSITIWINQSGNGFSDPITIKGTPAFSNRDSVRMVDLLGSGTPGILWSFDLGNARDRFAYLDLTGGVKPYVMTGMRNNLGARTRVQYGSSVAHYLRDTYGRPTPSDIAGDFTGYAGKWKTTLPFPVQVVDRVEVIDEISKGKLTTRYFYHHGYWDGGEREFRGFGRVDQFDTETFDRYNSDNLILDADLTGVSVEHYAPPVLTKNWFHLGPVGKEKGEWGEVDFSNEFWDGDTNMLVRDASIVQMLQGLPRRARRDAFRTLRGTALRSELYTMDGQPSQQRPYTVSETQTGLRLVDSPDTNPVIKALAVETHSNHIFFSFGLASRNTTWERGNDPMTKFSFTGAIDAYGQPLSQVSIAVPRGKDPRTGNELQDHAGVYDPARGYDATIQYTKYIYVDPAIADPSLVEDAIPASFPGQYMVGRAKKASSYEAVNNGTMTVQALSADVLKARDLWTMAAPRLLGLAYTYYDGPAFIGAAYGTIGAYGMPVRTETLMVQPDELTAVFGPAPHPAPFFGTGPVVWPPDRFPDPMLLQDQRCGYTWHAGGSGTQQYVAGYYTTAQATAFDFQLTPATAKGLPMQMRDVFQHYAGIEYDSYQLLPTLVRNHLMLTTRAAYDYRLMQARAVMDPNGNITAFAFTPLGLMHKTALLGKNDGTEGDTLDVPGVLLEYDLFAFKDHGDAVWVRTTQREHHINADYRLEMIPVEFNATIVAAEYSDGFGRQLQTRTQAEDVRFGDTILGDSGLPPDQTLNANAVGVRRGGSDPLNVVVSGAKLYNNKGKVVEQWEPYFDTGFDLTDPTVQRGQRVRMYYDALGRPQRTVHPDATEQRVVYGIPDALDTPDMFKASPWERYSYDALDLAPITHPATPAAPSDFTPKSESIDALGRTVRTTEHLAHFNGSTYEDVVMQYAYDIQGRLLKVTDPLGRTCFEHKYDIAGHNLWTKHLDSGEKFLVTDAKGKPVYSIDAKGARVFSAYDALDRPTRIWARDKGADTITLRQYFMYGEGIFGTNMEGRLWFQYDDGGKVQMSGYDFKGNPLEKTRWTINDGLLAIPFKFVVDWTPMNEAILDTTPYTTTLFYDGLNRLRKAQYPLDINGIRQVLAPQYNRAGTLEGVSLNSAPVLRYIAYNAKGQRILLARANNTMTRYAYDALTFRLQRIRTERYTQAGDTYTYASGTVRQDSGYAYDLGGNILAIKERVTDCGIQGSVLGTDKLDRLFEHDPLRRLLKATGREANTQQNSNHWEPNAITASPNATLVRAYTRQYSYDKVGNIQDLVHQATGNNFTRHYTYASGINRLLTIDNAGAPPTVNATFQYDAAGNLVKTDTTRYYEWDAADQLSYFKVQTGGSPDIQGRYLYAGGNRVKKCVRFSNGGIECTVYIDGIFEHRYNKSSGGGAIMAQQNILNIMDGRSRIASLRIGDPFGDSAPPTTFDLEDHLGTSTGRLDFGGMRVDQEEFYPFGESCLRTFMRKRYRYVGKELDEESGLYYYGARYYAAWTCRFISVDPLAHDYPMLNPYNYAANRCIGSLDLDGYQDPSVQPAPATAPQVPIEPLILQPVHTSVVLSYKADLPMLNYADSRPMGAREAAGADPGAHLLVGMAVHTDQHYRSNEDFLDHLNGDFHAFDSLEQFGGYTTDDPVYGRVWYPTDNFHDHSKMTRPEGVMYMSDDIPAAEFYFLMVGSWKSGYGHENYYFGPNSKIADALLKSHLGQQAMDIWRSENAGRTAGNYTGYTRMIFNTPTEENAIREWFGGIRTSGTPFTITHTLGSAMWTAEVAGDEVIFRAFNVTNVGSAIGANAGEILGMSSWKGSDMGYDIGYPKPKPEGQYPFTNISQTIEMRVPIGQILR